MEKPKNPFSEPSRELLERLGEEATALGRDQVPGMPPMAKVEDPQRQWLSPETRAEIGRTTDPDIKH